MDPALVRSIRLPGRVESVDAVAPELAALWRDAPEVTATDRARVETAVVEVVGNVVEHALAGVPDAEVTLEVRVDDRAVVVRLSDEGRPLDVDPAAATMPPADALGGRGLALALAVTDELTYVRDGDTNRWTLRCDRSTLP